MAKTTPTSKVNIESLLAKRNQISNAAIASALDKLEAKKREEQEAMLLHHLEKVAQNTSEAVEALRGIRKMEQIAKKRLETIAAAELQFHTDADIVAYHKAYKAACELV